MGIRDKIIFKNLGIFSEEAYKEKHGEEVLN